MIYDKDPVTGAMKKRWAGLSRTAKRVMNNLGIIADGKSGAQIGLHRSDRLHELTAYYNSTQYNDKDPWDTGCGEDYVAVRKRKPRIIVPFAKTLCSRIGSKLTGAQNFPKISVAEDLDTTEFLKSITKIGMIRARLAEPMRLFGALGSVFVRFYLVDGALKIEHFNSNYCYPKFSANGNLESVVIKYVYYSEGEYDAEGHTLRRWFKLELNQTSEIKYDNPVFDPKATGEPEFFVVDQVDHNLGYVQGTWWRTCEDQHSPDGDAIIGDILPFIDELCYSLSQTSQAISYNQDPQLVIKGMDTEEIDNLIRSSAKAWSLGRDGEANFIEANLTSVEKATESRKEIKQYAMDAARIVFMDPEKIIGHAQSGKALEILHGPMVELVQELQPHVERGIVDFYTKIALTILISAQQGMDTPIEIPLGWKPQSMDVTIQWPPVFPLTMEDLKSKASFFLMLSNGNILSRETVTRLIASDISEDINIEEEIAKIAAQPVINPFGAF